MKHTLEDIRNDFIDTVGDATERYGLTRIAGLLKGLLLLSTNPISLDEMAERLEVSKASVSTNIRLLERWRVVRRVFNRGDRKNYYEMRGNIWEIETDIASTIIKDELNGFQELLDRWQASLAEVEEANPEELEFIQNRFNELNEYMEAIHHLMKIIMSDGKVSPATIKKIQIE